MKYVNLLAGLLCSIPVYAQNKPPHIILIMTDQHRADALGCVENLSVITPNIDQLAAEGVRFVNGYSSVPSCTPARSGLLTGMAPWNHGMLGYGRVARKYPYEMPQMLRDAGYYTFGIGKMHWSPQKALHGFHGTLVDESGRVEQDGFISDYRNWFKLHAPGDDPDKTGIGFNEHRGGVYQLEEYLHPTSWTGKTAVRFIENYKRENPLFLKISFARPHSPYDPPQRFLDLYKDRPIPPPVVGSWCERFEEVKGGVNAFYGNLGRDYAIESRRHYYANITFIDEMIGEIIQALKQKGMYENTLICFTSDHGDMMGDHHHWRKAYAYEGSSKIPFIIKWPGTLQVELPRGSVLENPAELRDFLPTFLNAAGREIPQNMDGLSLLTLIQNPGAPWRSFIDMEHATCYSSDNYWAALTDGKWKYIWFFSTGEEQLFNLKADPHELADLAKEPAYTSELALWRNHMAEHLKQRGDAFVADNKPNKIPKTILYSPNYPDIQKTDSELLQEWRSNYKGIVN